MLRNKCAACATSLDSQDTTSCVRYLYESSDAWPGCVRCQTRYCSAACRRAHWRDGHEQVCEEIARGGGAEQHYADQKYAKAAEEAIKKCADDTKGQTCYICTQALHWKTKEGLVRGCSCRGTAGFAHVSCLAEQAKILVAEAEENNLSDKVFDERWARWDRCSLCEQRYHGDVGCAVGWACWKTYVGRSDDDWNRGAAMNVLGNELSGANHQEDALSVREAELARLRRLGAPEHHILVVQTNLALTYQHLGRLEQAMQMQKDVYFGRLKTHGVEQSYTLTAANNYAASLVVLRRYEEAKSLLRRTIPVARRVLGEGHDITLKIRLIYAKVLYTDAGATLDNLREAVTTLENLARTARRVFGGAHPLTTKIEYYLRDARAALAARETPRA